MPNAGVQSVPIEVLDPRRLEPFIGSSQVERLERVAGELREQLGGRRVVNVNSTATGGGVAEMLQTLLGYAHGMGVDAPWLAIQGDAEFFAVTKRVHNGLYGGPGDGGDLGESQREHYERTLAANAPSLRAAVRPGDILLVHDPQPAGLIPMLLELGVLVVWRCHVGLDETNEWADRAWAFIRPYVENAHGFVFSRREFAPDWIDARRLAVISPSIDPLAPKNVPLDAHTAASVLGAADVISYDGRPPDGLVSRTVHAVREGPPPGRDVPLVVQVSRWDRMKDMVGVLHGFAGGVPASTGANLVLAGPAVDTVGDDPEDRQILDETVHAWEALPSVDRARIHLVAIPMENPAENALVVNALQTHATIVVQKSLAEGFGLTVAEAMWKSRPVVATAVGGIVDQVVDGETGLLLRDPGDLEAFGSLLTSLLEDRDEAVRLGENARRHVTRHFLPDRQLLEYGDVLGRLLSA